MLLPELMQTMMGYSPTMARLILSPSGLFRMALVPGAGMMFVPLSTIAFRFLSCEERGNASALYALVRNEGSSLGVALVTTLLARSMQRHQASVLAYLEQFWQFGLLVILVIPLVFLLRRPAIDPSAVTEAVH